jgi:hypothetical protein
MILLCLIAVWNVSVSCIVLQGPVNQKGPATKIQLLQRVLATLVTVAAHPGFMSVQCEGKRPPGACQ